MKSSFFLQLQNTTIFFIFHLAVVAKTFHFFPFLYSLLWFDFPKHWDSHFNFFHRSNYILSLMMIITIFTTILFRCIFAITHDITFFILSITLHPCHLYHYQIISSPGFYILNRHHHLNHLLIITGFHYWLFLSLTYLAKHFHCVHNTFHFNHLKTPKLSNLLTLIIVIMTRISFIHSFIHLTIILCLNHLMIIITYFCITLFSYAPRQRQLNRSIFVTRVCHWVELSCVATTVECWPHNWLHTHTHTLQR